MEYNAISLKTGPATRGCGTDADENPRCLFDPRGPGRRRGTTGL